MLSKKLYYKKKTFKTIVIELFSLFLVMAFINIFMSSTISVNKNKLKFLPQNVLYEVLNGDGEEVDLSYQKKCFSIKGNQVSECYSQGFIRFPIIVDDDIIFHVTAIVCDVPNYYFNFVYGWDIKEEYNFHQGENTAVISYFLSNYNYSENCSIVNNETNEKININQIINVEYLNKSDAEEVGSDYIYLNFASYNKYFSEYEIYYSSVFYVYEHAISFNDIVNKIDPFSLHELNSYSKRLQEELYNFKGVFLSAEIINYVTAGIFICSILLMLIIRNNENKKINYINKVFYKKNKSFFIDALKNNLILVTITYVPSVFIIRASIVILQLKLNINVSNPLYFYFLPLVIYALMVIVDYVSIYLSFYLENRKN